VSRSISTAHEIRHPRPGPIRKRRGAQVVGEDIRAAVARANSSTPVGTLNGPKQDVALQASGQMDKAADYRHIVVAWRNGSPVKLDEVARIYDSVENDKIASWLNDERSIVLGIQKQPDANTVAVVDSLLAKLPALRAQVPPPVDISVLMDRSISIRQAVSDVEETLLIAVALVILVIFLFLRSASATFIPRFLLPDLVVLGTCAAMYALDYSINNRRCWRSRCRSDSWSTMPS
jgi:HAE1 family hydrophobic/amphiphilic exporter-1